jgi:cytochrome c oxidase cbb3-type subunit 3
MSDVPSRQPATATEPILLDHDNDGIREYDNPTPGWWTMIFWGSVGFAVLYFAYYHVGVGPSLDEKYQAELGAYYAAQAEKLGDLQADRDTILWVADDPKTLLGGAAMFRSNCAQCHAADGGGGTGPNLTDDAWINVKNVEDIYGVLHGGLVGKGMPEWGTRFKQPQLVVLASYVASLRGTAPAAPKPAQGETIAAWPAKPEAPPPAIAAKLEAKKAG